MKYKIIKCDENGNIIIGHEETFKESLAEENLMELRTNEKDAAKKAIEVRNNLIRETFFGFNMGLVLMGNPDIRKQIEKFVMLCKNAR